MSIPNPPEQKQRSTSLNLTRSGDTWAEISRAVQTKYTSTLSACLATSNRYEDAQFPANSAALYGQGSLLHGPNHAWKQATPEQFPTGATIFGSSPTAQALPTDVKQGLLGDCWFLSALSVLADVPGGINDIVLQSPKLNAAGLYAFRFFINGVWQAVFVDGQLPWDAQRGQWAYSVSSRQQADPCSIWVSLMEKAYAKFHRSYRHIAAGQVGDALSELTGAPSVRYNLDPRKGLVDSDWVWTILLSSKESKFIMCAGTAGASEGLLSSVGLHPHHAYSILDVRTVIMQEGQRHQRIVQVRNPWATSEFKGYDWAQHLPTEIATSAEKSSVSTSGGGGVFWLEWDLFLTFFRSVTVCKVMKNAFQHSAITTCAALQGFVPDGLKATANKTKLSKAVYRITTEHKTWAHVSALQPSQRGYTAPPHKYASIGLLVSSSVAAETDIDSGEEDSEDEELALALALSKGLAVDTVPVTPPQQASKPEEDGKAVERKAAVLEGITFPRNIRHAELSVLLLPGRVYEVTAFCFEGPSRMPLVLSAYTQTEVEIQVSERSTAADSQDFPRLLNDGVAQHRQTQRTPCLDMLTRQPSGLFCNVLRQGHVVILQAVNTCNTGKACMTSCRESTGVAFSRGGSICRDLIPAQSKQILMICTVLDQYKGYTFKHSCGTVELVVECREHHSPALASLRDVHTPVFS